MSQDNDLIEQVVTEFEREMSSIESNNIWIEIFCENWQNPVKQRITPHFLTTRPSNYYEFTTKE